MGAGTHGVEVRLPPPPNTLTSCGSLEPGCSGADAQAPMVGGGSAIEERNVGGGQGEGKKANKNAGEESE